MSLHLLINGLVRHYTKLPICSLITYRKAMTHYKTHVQHDKNKFNKSWKGIKPDGKLASH